MRDKLKPSNGWAIPFATGHRYRFHWGEGLDFERMNIEMANRWVPSDLNVHMVTNFTDVRAAVNMTDEFNVLIANETYITKVEDELINGDYVVYNQTEVREFHFVLNGKDMDNRANMVMTGHRCIVDCD